MYSKKRTLADKFTLTNSKIDLPRDAVIDETFIKCTVNVKNAGGSEWVGLMSDILEKLQEIRIVSDGNNVHYSLNGLDVALLNWYDLNGRSVNPDAAATVGAGANKDFKFTLKLDEGDILAVTKDSLEFSMNVATAVDTDVTIDAFTGIVSLSENIFDPAEFAATYGASAEMAAEPKITTFEKKFDASEELREFIDLPTGTLLRRALWMSKDSDGVRAGVIPSKMGIIATTPDKREIYTIDFETLQDHNKYECNLPAAIAGCALIDYGEEITCDDFGLRAWKFNKGDYQGAVKAAEDGKLRCISVEYVVNTQTFDMIQRAILEAN